MVCKICGKQLPDGSSVCKYCGAKQRNPGSDPKPDQPRRYSKKGLARRRMINTVLLGVVALLIVGIIAGIVMSTRSAGDLVDQDAQLSATPNEDENTPNEDEIADVVEEPDEDEESEEPDVTGDETEDPDETEGDPEDESTEDPDESEDPEVTGSETEDPDETENPAETETPDESETPDEPTEETDASAEPETPVIITGNYTAHINRSTVTASLNHYRILTVAINETLPAGVEVQSVSFTSSNSAIVRTEVVEGEGRAWGVALGKATVTGTVTLSTGETASASCEVTVVEYQEPPEESKPSDDSGSSSKPSAYILPGSDSRVYSVSELNKLSTKQLRLARNEIYARHGRIFNDPELQDYFESKSWYKGTIAADKFDPDVLNATEKKNIENIQKAEKD